jgi:phosphatidylglycerol:prolipoprotein diacylglycerol transferase
MEYQLIDPVLIRIGPLSVRWYGLMYILGFLSSYLLVLYQIKKRGAKIKKAVIDDLYFYIIIGLIIGARLGYVIFYNPVFYLKNPLDIFAIWHGGMSFHGGLVGAFIAGYIIIRKEGLTY